MRSANQHHPFRNHHVLWISILLFVALIILASFLFQPLVHRYVTKILNRSPEYQASVGDITIHIWRGAYQINDLVIKKASGKVPVPLFSSKTIDLSIEWRALFHGALVGEVEVDQAQLNFVGASSKAAAQSGENTDWIETVKDLFPLKINRFAVKDSEVHYRDFQTTPQVNVYLKDVNVEATNLTNSERLSKSLVAHVKASGNGVKSGQLAGEMSLDPYAKRPKFDLAISLLDVNLPDLNEFLRAYAAIDVSKGKFSMFGEFSARETTFEGYAKPLLSEVQILDLKKDPRKPLKFIWETIVAAVAEIFTNHAEDQLATKIPISGTFENPDTGIWSSFLYLVQNAFIKALKPGLEGEIDFSRKHALKKEQKK